MNFQSIPASKLVSIYPDVLGAGGNPLGLNTTILDQGAIYPAYEYTNATLVGDHYGTTSSEYLFASVYFNGYVGATTRPNSLFITKFNSANTAARLIGGSVASLTLDQLKAITGTLSVTIDGVVKSGTVTLTAATSFSDAATIIGTAITATVEYNAQIKAFIVKSGTTGTTSTISYATGVAAPLLFLSQDKGAIVDNDTVADTVITATKRATNYSMNFAVVTYIGAAFDDAKQKEISAWNTSQNGRYWFVQYGLDPLAIVPNNPSSFGAWLEQTEQNGTTPIYGDIQDAALACGYAASINFEETNGRTVMAFRRQAGLDATVVDENVADALESNGYSYYGAWATANERFVMFGNGRVSGDFKWVDNYLFAVFQKSQFELAYMNMLVNYGSIPYNTDGIAIYRAVSQDPINQGVNFGGIRSGVTLTEQQKNVINLETGFDAASQLFTKGWVLSVQLPSPQVRAARGSFIVKFFYTDGSSLQRIEMTTTNVQ